MSEGLALESLPLRLVVRAGDDSGGAGPVIHHEVLSEPLLDRGLQRTNDDVAASTRRIGEHDPNGLRGILRECALSCHPSSVLARNENGLHRCNPLIDWRARQNLNPRTPGS